MNFGLQDTNVPWTKNYNSCGQHGDHIYITPKYILDPKFRKVFGSKGKLMLFHETFVHYFHKKIYTFELQFMNVQGV